MVTSSRQTHFCKTDYREWVNLRLTLILRNLRNKDLNLWPWPVMTWSAKISKLFQKLTLKQLKKTTLTEYSNPNPNQPPEAQTLISLMTKTRRSNQSFKTSWMITIYSWRHSPRLRRSWQKWTLVTRSALAKLRLSFLTLWKRILNFLWSLRWWRTSCQERSTTRMNFSSSTHTSSRIERTMTKLIMMESTREFSKCLGTYLTLEANDGGLFLEWCSLSASEETSVSLLRKEISSTTTIYCMLVPWLKSFIMEVWWLMILKIKVWWEEDNLAAILNTEKTMPLTPPHLCISLLSFKWKPTSRMQTRDKPSKISIRKRCSIFILVKTGTFIGITAKKCQPRNNTSKWSSTKLQSSQDSAQGLSLLF